MTNPKIKFKRSAVASKRPSLTNLDLGELAINYYDGSIFAIRDTGGVGIATTVANLTPWKEEYDGDGIEYTGNVDIQGALIKSSGTFRIPHPIKPETHKLVHSFVEGPLCDLIYRGKAKLTGGKATININEYFGMTPGTFEALVDDTDVFITNNNSWDPVRGRIEGADLHIECKNPRSATTVSWLVIGDRKDDNIKSATWTDGEGKPILEPPNKGIIQKNILDSNRGE